MARPVPLVYADSVLFFNVIKREVDRTGEDPVPLWPDSLKVLNAAERGEIHLLASTLVHVEVAGSKGDTDPQQQDDVLDRYLDHENIIWVEVDRLVAREARLLARRYDLRGADAAHLATAVRHHADYFMSRNGAFPYGATVDGVRITTPQIVWQQTFDDAQIDQEYAAELAAEQAEEAARSAAKAAKRASKKLAAPIDRRRRIG